MNKEEFLLEIEKIGIIITKEQVEKLDQFYKLLCCWNKKINLTRIIEEDSVYLKHFYDSLTIARVVDLSKKETLCDVGSGAGFPGIVLKIIYPNLNMVLIDSLQKRVNYLNQIIKELQLTNIIAIHTRAEDYKGKFDIVTARAVANLSKLLDYTMHLVKDNGDFVAMKGDIDMELDEELKQKLEKNYKIIKIDKFLLPKEKSKRSLIVIENR